MPLLMVMILLAVQFSMYHLGRQTASSAARETARVMRVTGDPAAARARGQVYIDQVGKGVLDAPEIVIRPLGTDRVQVEVTGKSLKVLPWVPAITQKVEAPVERFVEAS
ncbi:pilus assembly protein [Nocardioides daphniae]|nr:pilus assembly protein [Nocardioides daphniae]